MPESIDLRPTMGAQGPAPTAPAENNRSASVNVVVPPAGTAPGGTVSGNSDLPSLALPKVGGLALEQLMQAVGLVDRHNAVVAGRDALEAKGKERSEANAKALEEIQKRLEDMRAKEKLSPFLKAFKFIGMIVGAIASAATIALGAVTGNPLLVAAGVVMAVMTVNSIVSEASDGKYSIAAGVAELAKKCGASEETAQWIGFGVEIGITVVGCVMSLGAGASSAAAKGIESAAKASEIASKVTQIAANVSKASTALNALNTVGQGVTSGVDAYYSYKITTSQADQKQFDAIIERITQSMEMESDFMETIMKRAEELLETVTDIVKGNTEAQTAILTNAAPTAA
jgi:hypothetical protein